MILLDVRYSYNEDGENDRLGKQQWEWLDNIFAENRNSDVTMIMSGVQILPERPFSYIEELGQPNKDRIISLIQKYKKSGVLLFSGDVHYGQLYSSKCESLTGYKLLEVCSSGLTHVLNDPYKPILNLVEAHTPEFYIVTLN